MSVTTDVYKLLFGRKGIADGDVISMAEHGRTGGVSTGQPFKFVDNTNYDIKLVEDGSSTYVAYAKPGTAEDSSAWKVMKMDTSSGMKITWAGGSPDFLYKATNLPALFP